MTKRQIASIVILLLCGMAFYVIPLQTEDGEDAFLSGASLIPDLAVSLIFLFTALDLLFSFLSRQHTAAPEAYDIKSPDVAIGANQLLGVTIVAGLLATYAYFMLQAGYILSSSLLLLGLMFCAGGRRPWLMISVAITLSLILYVGLRFGFGIHLSAFAELPFSSVMV